jgi:hypothetical protein
VGIKTKKVAISQHLPNTYKKLLTRWQNWEGVSCFMAILGAKGLPIAKKPVYSLEIRNINVINNQLSKFVFPILQFEVIKLIIVLAKRFLDLFVIVVIAAPYNLSKLVNNPS